MEDYYYYRAKAFELGFSLTQWWRVYNFWVDPQNCTEDEVKEASRLSYQTLYDEWLASHETLLGREAFNE